MFCAALVLGLGEPGALDLDWPVEQHLPGFAFDDRVHGPRVTLRHLLSHSSGLPGAGKDRGPCAPTALRVVAYEQPVHIPADGRTLRFATDWAEGDPTPFGARRFPSGIGQLEFG